MIQELETQYFQRIFPLIPDHPQYVPVLSVLDGNFPGRIFVDQREHPRTALVWAVSRWSYLVGSPTNEVFFRHLPELVTETLIPAAKELHMDHFEMYLPADCQWTAIFEQTMTAVDLHKHEEMIFSLDAELFRRNRVDPILDEGVVISPVDTPILEPEVINISWIPAEARTRTTFGFMVTDGKSPLSLCRSNGFISGNRFMVDVETFDTAHRQRGYARSAGTALIDLCLEKKLHPFWETTEDNIGSQKLASRLGFVRREHYPVYGVYF